MRTEPSFNSYIKTINRRGTNATSNSYFFWSFSGFNLSIFCRATKISLIQNKTRALNTADSKGKKIFMHMYEAWHVELFVSFSKILSIQYIQINLICHCVFGLKSSETVQWLEFKQVSLVFITMCGWFGYCQTHGGSLLYILFLRNLNFWKCDHPHWKF